MARLHHALCFAVLAAVTVAAGGCGGCGGGAQSEQEAGADASFEASVDSSLQADAPSDTGAHEGEGGDGNAGIEAGPLPVSPGGTGAFGVVTLGGKQKLYLPQPQSVGNATIAVVDVGLAGAGVAGVPALIKSIDLGTFNQATTTAGGSAIIIAASTFTNDVWFIDPSADTLTKHITLDSTFGQSGFSGGGGYVTGIAIDEGGQAAYLSVWDGLAVIDLGTLAVTKTIQAPPSENFGFDSVHHLVFAPFYDCLDSASNGATPSSCGTPTQPDGGVMLAGLSVVDLSDDTVYTYEDDGAMQPGRPLGGEPDSASVDTSTQVVIVSAEGDGYQNVLDFSKAQFEKTTRTVTAPHAILQNLDMTGVAIEPTTHLAFLEAESQTDVAVTNASQANAGAQSFVQGTMPDVPSGGGFSNIGDPHGVAAALSILGNKPVGFVVANGMRWVARVDLTQLVALEVPDGGVVAGPSQIAAAVTYLDATMSESGGD